MTGTGVAPNYSCRAKQPCSIELLRQVFTYDPLTGEFFWRDRPLELFEGSNNHDRLAGQRSWNQKYAGQRVRSARDNKGYPRLRFLGLQVLAHRAAFALHHGRWPTMDIDHIDGDRANARIANLREVSMSGNHRNRHTPTMSAAGVPGVFWHSKDRRWIVTIGDEGRGRYLGRFTDVEEAIAARRKAEAELGYAPTHCRTSSAYAGVVSYDRESEPGAWAQHLRDTACMRNDPPSSSIPPLGEPSGAGPHGPASVCAGSPA